MTEQTYSIDDLALLTDLNKRTVRYYIQMGLVPRPIGEGRAAHYKTEHLDRLLKVKNLTSEGLSLDRIGSILSGRSENALTRKAGIVEMRSHLQLAPGLEIVISPSEAKISPEKLHDLAKAIMEASRKVLNQPD